MIRRGCGCGCLGRLLTVIIVGVLLLLALDATDANVCEVWLAGTVICDLLNLH